MHVMGHRLRDYTTYMYVTERINSGPVNEYATAQLHISHRIIIHLCRITCMLMSRSIMQDHVLL